MIRSNKFLVIIMVALVTITGGLITANSAYQTVSLQSIEVGGSGLNLDEEAYYEYVAPRMQALVEELGRTRDLVDSKSRDIISLGRAGTIIEKLTGEIRSYGEENGVPPRFADVHSRILVASDSVTHTFDEARKALRTFNFSQMATIIEGFAQAADEFAACQYDLQALV